MSNAAPNRVASTAGLRAVRSDGRSLEALLDRMVELMALEREALRQRDAGQVLALADEKESLLEFMQERMKGRISKGTAERLRSVAADLRRNGILLAFARDSLRDALAALERAGHAPSGKKNGRIRVVG